MATKLLGHTHAFRIPISFEVVVRERQSGSSGIGYLARRVVVSRGDICTEGVSDMGRRAFLLAEKVGGLGTIFAFCNTAVRNDRPPGSRALPISTHHKNKTGSCRRIRHRYVRRLARTCSLWSMALGRQRARVSMGDPRCR